ncbi:MAG: hypothetical protein Q4C72_00445 [Eubacteriales bacterium]|nr:hypothetical protein [Eubacteriales bacterium]
MKKRFCLPALALALAAALTAPAGAYYLMDDGYSIFPNEETYRWTEQNKVNLPKEKWNAVAADNWNFCGEFHEGLLLINEAVTTPPDFLGGYNPNYVDKNGNLVDLNRNRYWMMYPFYQGLAAAAQGHTGGGSDEGGVAYIDRQGNEIIPFNQEWTTYRTELSSTVYYTGRFENGKALVVRHGDLYHDRSENWGGFGFEYAYIDAKGSYLTQWKEANDRNTIISLPLYDQNGVWIGFREDEAAWAAHAIPYEKLFNGGKEADGGAQAPADTPAEQPFVPEWHAPALPDYNENAPSLFASHAKVTGYHLGDLDFGSATVTITNPTKLTDAGVIAVSFVNVDGSSFDFDGDGVFFIAYELAPGESRGYEVMMRGIINQEMFAPGAKHQYAEQFSSHVESAVWMFENDDDLRDFYESVPYEQHWYPRNHMNEFQPICDGQAGTDWLRTMADTVRQPNNLKMIDYYLPDGSTIQASETEHSAYCAGH